MIEWQSLIQWALGLVIMGIASGLGVIAKILLGQNKALALLVERVGTVNVEALVKKVNDLESRCTTNEDKFDTRLKADEEKIDKLDAAHEGKLARIASLEADMSRVWGIYDAWRVGHSPIPTGQERS